jgi:alpha-ketoglutarate-dependent taurine dioxygenase
MRCSSFRTSFPDQHLSRDEQIAFAKRFGNLEFEFASISNAKADGTLIKETDHSDLLKILQGNMGWHCDSTYMSVQAKGAVFSAITVPKTGGETGWADMRAAYDALNDEMRAKIGPLPRTIRSATARPKLDMYRKKEVTIAVMAFTTDQCPLGRWSRFIPKPRANRSSSDATLTAFPT